MTDRENSSPLQRALGREKTPSALAFRSARQVIRGADWLAQRIGATTPPIQKLLADRHLAGMLAERTTRDQPEGKRLALTFDLDYQRDTDVLVDLVDLVDRAGVTMSLCSIAALVEADPDPYRRAVSSGHEIVNHSWTHPDNPVLDPDREFWNLSVEEIDEQVSRANELFESLLGVRASGFRTPHFKDVARMIPVLEADPDTRYVSSVLETSTLSPLPYVPAMPQQSGRISHRVARHEPVRPTDLIQLPLTACPDHRWSPFCSYHHLRAPANHSKGAGMHDVGSFERDWAQLRSDHAGTGYLSFYFDPHDIMRDDETARAFERCLVASVADGWDIVTLAEMAEAWAPHVGQRR